MAKVRDTDLLVRLPDGAFAAGVGYQALREALLRREVQGERRGRSWWVSLADCERIRRERESA